MFVFLDVRSCVYTFLVWCGVLHFKLVKICGGKMFKSEICFIVGTYEQLVLGYTLTKANGVCCCVKMVVDFCHVDSIVDACAVVSLLALAASCINARVGNAGPV
jgi:hypothetical protein